MTNMTTMVIDNFLPYPGVVRSWALQQKFYDCKEMSQKYNCHNDWPGKRTHHVSDLDIDYANVVLTKISEIATRYYNLQNTSVSSSFQLTTKNDGDSWVHQDNDAQLAMILYLTPNPPRNSGTTIYHCKDIQKWQSYMGTQSGYETLKTINTKGDVDLYESLFEPIDIIGNVFNRLMIYPGLHFHKSNEYFGDTLENGRLTQMFFLREE